jgi:hypothetical protein
MCCAPEDPAILLLAIIESGFADRPAAPLRAESPTALAYLEQIGALKPSSTLWTVWCRACDKDHDARVELDLTGKARHFCPEAGWVDDNDDDLASLRLDREWLLDWLERIFSVIPPRRRRVLLGDRIWHIGEAVLGKTSVTIVFSRGFFRRTELSAALAQVPPTEVGIVLTTVAEVPTDPFAVHGYCAVNLDQILLPKADGLVIDQGRFAGLIRAFARKTRPVAGRGGRLSEARLILEIFRARRTRKTPYRTKSAEAKDIIAEWPDHHPDVDPPGYSTIRRHLPNPGQ